MDIGHWLFPIDFIVEDWFGFIYRIVDTDNNKHYVGKKQFFSHRTKKVANRKNKKHFLVESNWKKYTGSSTNVNEAIETKGKDKFVFIIESLHSSKSSLHYAEVKLQIDDDVLRARHPNGDRKFYNGVISGVKFLPPNLTDDELNMRISSILKDQLGKTDVTWYSSLNNEIKLLLETVYNISAPGSI